MPDDETTTIAGLLDVEVGRLLANYQTVISGSYAKPITAREDMDDL